MWTMRIRLLALLLAPVLLAGCGAAPKDAAAPPLTRRIDGIRNKYWKLITLEGQAVTMAPGQEREAHFMLRDSSRVTG